MMKRFLLLIITLLTAASCAVAQGDNAILKGRVVDENGEPLAYANIHIKENNHGASADKDGSFRIITRQGSWTVEVSFIGYEKHTEKIVLQKGKTVERMFKLKSSSFQIGGIDVVADNQFIPINPETKTIVTSGEIEHIQASSLNDVMKLAPGVETTNPTLNTVEKASIRSGEAIGTQILLDGIPVTNNSNMQVGIGNSSSNSGVDLRSIPAENIKEVEIIRGIPSAQYGDLTDGLLIVKTKSSAEPLRAKYKYNPQLNEINLSGGNKIADWVFNGNFNLAVSERDIRVEGDGYTRIAGQLTAERETEEFLVKNILYITRAIDESKEKPGYALREAWYNRDLNIKYTGNYSRIYSSFSSVNLNLSASYTKRNSYSQQLISRDNIVITDSRIEGTGEGRIVFGSYLGQKWIKGSEWNLYGDLNYNFRFFTDEILHNWIAGATYRNDFNNGQGVIFDPLYPPSLSVPTPRLRSYDELPAYNIVSIYAEDKITGRIWKPFTLQAGIRYELYRPYGFDIKGLWGKGDLVKSHNGSFANPRVNFSFNLFEDTQIRLSYGVTSKSPQMPMIFADKKYYDVVDTVSVRNPQYPDSNYSLISTYIREQANSELKGYTQKKYEASIDQQIGSLGFTITGYYNNSDNMFDGFTEPTVFYKKSFPNWPDGSIYTIKDTVADSYIRYLNNGWQKVSGIEFSLRTKKIPVINTVFKFDGSYSYQQNGNKNGYYFSSARFSNALNMKVTPMYNSVDYFSKDLLLNYRFEIQAKSLGMWITIHLQQKVIEISGRRGYADTLAIGYFTQKGDIVHIPEAERADPRYSQLKRNIESFELNDEDKPNKWLVNLKVSKSLWSGASVSFYVNNFLNNQPLYKSRRRSPDFPSYDRRNPDIFYGIEFSSSLGGL